MWPKYLLSENQMQGSKHGQLKAKVMPQLTAATLRVPAQLCLRRRHNQLWDTTVNDIVPLFFSSSFQLNSPSSSSFFPLDSEMCFCQLFCLFPFTSRSRAESHSYHLSLVETTFGSGFHLVIWMNTNNIYARNILWDLRRRKFQTKVPQDGVL